VHFIDVACEDEELLPWNGRVLWKGMALAEVIERLETLAPRYVLVTAMFTCDHPVVEAFCRGIKQHFGDRIALILGGRHASLMPHWFLEGGAVDFLVQGEGERIVVELIDALSGRSPAVAPDGIPGVLTRPDDRGAHPSAWAEAKLGGSYAYDAVLWNADGSFRYRDVELEGSPKDMLYKRGRAAELLHSAPIMPTRGCPLACRFCGSHFTPELRHVGGERLFADLERCYERGVRVFYNISENFCLNADDKAFVARVADWRGALADEQMFWMTNPNSSYLPIYLDRHKRPNLPLIDTMKRAGFDLVTISLETTAPRFDDKKLFRKYTVAQMEALWQAFAERGLELHLYMMSGFPGMTEDELKADVGLVRRWVEAGLCGAASWSNLIYLPGTPYFDEAVRDGKFSEASFRQRIDSGFNFFAVSDEFNFSAIPTPRLREILLKLRQGDYEV
jgi:radical SAM superfamily enzyme YgiQ (UPF0313 family)